MQGTNNFETAHCWSHRRGHIGIREMFPDECDGRLTITLKRMLCSKKYLYLCIYGKGKWRKRAMTCGAINSRNHLWANQPRFVPGVMERWQLPHLSPSQTRLFLSQHYPGPTCSESDELINILKHLKWRLQVSNWTILHLLHFVLALQKDNPKR